MAQPGLFPLLALPQPAVLTVFYHLHELSDAVNLSQACKEMWELGSAARRRFLCCAACGHHLADAAAAFSSDIHCSTPRLDLPDGRSFALDAAHLRGGCRLAEGDHPVEGAFFPVLLSLRMMGLRRAGDPGHEARAQHVQCGGCGLHLGIRLVELDGLRVGAVASCIRHWRELRVLAAAFLARPYLRVRAADGREEHYGGRPPPPGATALYRCSGARAAVTLPHGKCGAPLFTRRDILSREHCWDAGDGPECAFYVNALLPGAAVQRQERQEELCQGQMQVADVYCVRCHARIGWRFCADLSASQENANQAGRYGVVCSSLEAEHGGPAGARGS